MTQPNTSDPEKPKEAKLPRRDWVLLPLLGLLTICLMVVSLELIAGRMFSESPSSLSSCYGPLDPETGRRAIPNSVCWDKVLESSLVEYKFNSCGYRGGIECGPKSASTYRIVMIGTSFAQGGAVQQENTFAALLPSNISRQTGRKIELYNEGNFSVHPHGFALRMNEVLAAEPDAILWILTPHDVEEELPDAVLHNPRRDQSSLLARVWFRIKATFASKSILDTVHELWQNQLWKIKKTATATLLLHFLYESRSQYLKSYLAAGDSAGFLRVQPSAKWQNRLVHFESDATEIERRAKAAGVPLMVTLVPNRAQAAMISMGEWPAGYDPYKLNDELRSIIVRHGGVYIDILPDYRNIANPEQGYFPVDGHPNADGHATISKLLAKKLTSGAVPALRVTTMPQLSSSKPER